MDANGYRNEALKENTPLGIPQMDTENDALEKVVPFNYGYFPVYSCQFSGVSIYPLKYIYTLFLPGCKSIAKPVISLPPAP